MVLTSLNQLHATRVKCLLLLALKWLFLFYSINYEKSVDGLWLMLLVPWESVIKTINKLKQGKYHFKEFKKSSCRSRGHCRNQTPHRTPIIKIPSSIKFIKNFPPPLSPNNLPELKKLFMREREEVRALQRTV
jgi:hypothetical protein